jgi:hypothetical protein
LEKQKGRKHLEDAGVDWRIVLVYILNEYDRKGLTAFILSKTKYSGDLL